MTIVVGLTGGIACGKTAVTTKLRESGVAVLDCDQIARDVVAPGTPGLESVKREFGEELGERLLLPDGTLNRKALGAVVFASVEKRRKLQAITNPAIFKELLKGVVKHFLLGTRVVVVDAPTLYETRLLARVCSKVVVVATTPQHQLERLMRRDQNGEEDARNRIAAQMPLSEKVAMADVTLWNNGTLEEIESRAATLAAEMREWGGGWRMLMSGPGWATLLAAGLGVARFAMAAARGRPPF